MTVNIGDCDNKREFDKIKSKRKRNYILIGAISATALAVAGVVTGVVLSAPKYLEFNVSGQGDLTVNGEDKSGEITYKQGDTICLEAEEIKGYSFAGWYLNGEKIEGADEYTFEFILSSKTQGNYEARFVANEYSLNTSQNLNIEELKINGENLSTANIGDSISFKAKSYQGKRIQRVYYKVGTDEVNIEKNGEEYVFVMPAEDIEICVEYVKIDFSATKSEPQNGSIKVLKSSREITTANFEERIEIEAIAQTGYQISKVYYSINNGQTKTQIFPQDGKYFYTMSAENVCFYAEFEKKIFNLSAQENITLLNTTAYYQDNIEVGVLPKEGHTIQRVYYKTSQDSEENIPLSQGKYSFTMPSQDVSVYVEYSLNRYLVNYTTPSNGTYEVKNRNIAITASLYGASLEVVCTPTSGYRVDKVYYTFGDDNKTYITKTNDKYIFTQPAGNITVYVIFVKLVTTFEENGLTYSLDYTLKSAKIVSTTSNIENLIIPQTITVSANEATYKVTEISQDAFKNSASLKSLKIEKNLSSIGGSAFENCHSLKKIDLSSADDLATIGVSAFKNCDKAVEISFPKEGNISSIGKFAFSFMTGIKTLDLSNQAQLQTIGEGLFQGMHRVEQISFPSSIQTISSFAFSGCDRLLMLTIPAGVTSLSQDIFKSVDENISGVGHLLEITNLSTNSSVLSNLESAISSITNSNGITHIMSSGETSKIVRTYASIDNSKTIPVITEGESYDEEAGEFIWYISQTQSILVGYYGTSEIMNSNHEIVLPTSQQNYTLLKNFNLNEENTCKITIPSNLISICDYAFQNNTSLTSIILNGSPTISSNAFKSLGGTISLYFENATAYTNFSIRPSDISSVSLTIYVKMSIIDDEFAENPLFDISGDENVYYIMEEL